mgnify:CR=1 FL=1
MRARKLKEDARPLTVTMTVGDWTLVQEALEEYQKVRERFNDIDVVTQRAQALRARVTISSAIRVLNASKHETEELLGKD